MALLIENVHRRRGTQEGVAGRGPCRPGVAAAGRKVPPSGHAVRDPIYSLQRTEQAIQEGNLVSFHSFSVRSNVILGVVSSSILP